MLWNQTYGGSAESVLYSIIQVTNNGYVLAGFTNSSSTNQDVWIIKTDENGVMPEFSRFYTSLAYICTLFVGIVMKKIITKKT